MLFHPRIDGGIALDGAVESQQIRFHRGSTFRRFARDFGIGSGILSWRFEGATRWFQNLPLIYTDNTDQKKEPTTGEHNER
jgi:hypothetical protein